MPPFSRPRSWAPRRSPRVALCEIALDGIASGAWGRSASGTVRSSSGTALAGVVVTVRDSSARLGDTTDAAGNFSLGSASTVSIAARSDAVSVRREGGDLQIQHPGEGVLECSLVDIAGTGLWSRRLVLSQGLARASLTAARNVSIGVLRIRQGEEVLIQQILLSNASGWKEMARHAFARRRGLPDASFPQGGLP